jgi:uncharacterized membrane protein (DUF2068 family)
MTVNNGATTHNHGVPQIDALGFTCTGDMRCRASRSNRPFRRDSQRIPSRYRRYRLRVDWNLRSCGRRGHVTYAPDEADLRISLEAQTPLGEAWRCLRCGDYVLGAPKGSGPAADAPEVRRGRALRDLVILRLLSLERLVRGLVVLLAAVAVFRFRDHRISVQKAFSDDLPAVENLAEKFHWDIANSSIIIDVEKAIQIDRTTLTWVALGLFVYGLLQLIEATGLWLLKRWGEYFAAVATALFIPLEGYELSEKLTWVRVGALIINVAAVLYLVLTKRLFGVRGGRAAYEAERHEVSLLEVEAAADETQIGKAPEPVASGSAPSGPAEG